jgi:6-phosphogluconolactonase (cycloisomerase 2 family)
VVDRLASQGSLTYDDERAVLYAVDAGSDALVVFAVDGEHLGPPQRLPSGGRFPVSVAVHDDLVYVLNARDGGSIHGYRRNGDGIAPLAGSTRALGLDTSTLPEFTHTPGQVGFSPDGDHLIVTTKANDSILVFAVDDDGRPGADPRVHRRPGAIPFSFTFTPAGHLVMAETGPSAISSFALGANGSLSPLDSVATGQSATCWVTGFGSLLFASNAGSSTVSSFRVDDDGYLTRLATTPTSPGTIDAAVSADGRHLYVQAGGVGVVDEFAVHADGSLTPVGAVAVPGSHGGEGIVAV